MSITGLAIKRPILFIVLFLILGGLSFLSYQHLKYELLPDLATPAVTIITAYPGASPEDVENSVTKKIEEAVSTVSKTKKVSGNSLENVSVVSVEFVADADQEQALQDVQRAVNTILADFPAGVKTPVLEKFNVNDLPVVKLAVTSDLSASSLYDLVNNQIKTRLAQLKGVGKVKILGGRSNEIKVLARQDKLTSIGLPITALFEAIQRENLDYPVGTIKDNDAQFGVRVSGKFSDTNQVKSIVVKKFDDGSIVRVGDLAYVYGAPKEEDVRSRLNGKSSVAIFINKQSGSNAAAVAKLVREAIVDMEKDYKQDHLQFNVAQDSSEFTLAAAHQVYEDIGVAILLVALVMLVFLHSLRNAVIIMVSIPASLFSAFIMMYALGYSLNLMTLLAISLVIGVLVDDSIVVLENIYHHLEMGKDKRVAALDGRNQIGFAALSITFVDVVVFLPMALVTGLVGSLIKEFSLVIVVSTLSSLVVSFTLTPIMASRFSKLEHLSPATFLGRAGLWFEGRIRQMTRGYGKLLHWSLKHKIIIGIVAISTLAGAISLLTTGIVGTEFLPAADKGEMSLFVELEPGAKLNATDSTVRIIEGKLKSIPEVTRLFSNIGYQNDGFDERYNTNIATVNISLVPVNERKKSLAKLSREVKALAMQVPGVKSRVSPIGLFGANEAPIQLLVTGTNRDSVNLAAERILQRIRLIEGVLNPRLSSQEGKPELKLVLDREKMAAMGLSTATVGNALRMSVYGYDEMKFRDHDKEKDIHIQLNENDINHTGELLNLSFVNEKGQIVYLNQFAEVTTQAGSSALNRRNKQPCVAILSQVSSRPVGDVGADIKTAIDGLQLNNGITVKYEGDLELQDDSFGSLITALLVSLILVYLIMVLLYNNWISPFIILFSIPLALCGALLALALTGKSLNVFAIFGLIMMMGLVVKNGILLVDRTNELLGDNVSTRRLIQALVEAGESRFRPILMTTLAMVIGMLPLALASGASAAFSSGLAWVLVGGLSSSMFLTLVVVPVVYYVVTRLRRRFRSTGGKRLAYIPAKAVLLLMIIVSFTMKGKSQEKVSLSLKQAVDSGLIANQQIKIAEIEAKKAKYSLKEAQSYLYPQIEATATYMRNIKPVVFYLPTFGINAAGQITYDAKQLQAIPASAANAYTGTVNVNMPLFNATVSGNVKSAKLNENLQMANVELSRWELADEIRKAYFNVLISRQQLATGVAALNRAEQRLNESKTILSKGYASVNDTLTAWSNVSLMHINVMKAQTAVEISSNYLKSMLDLSPDAELDLTDTIGMSLLGDQQLLVEISKAESKRPDFQVNDWKRQIAEQEINNEKVKRLPSLGFIGQYGIQAQSENFKFGSYQYPNNVFVGVQLSIPIFTGFRTDARVRQSMLQLDQLAAERILLTKQASLQIRNGMASLVESKSKIERLKELCIARERSLEFVRSRWKMGLVKYTEVADADLSLLQSNNDYTQGVFEYLSAIATLSKVTGSIH
ncbi:efflux RND transporter permease subunit [Chitinophaga sp.]|uniref:efflux RND transporter permease subunit n=1 Tax=Chitinophaga sp. TaxID=1869181 RepID=UPI0031DD06ED